MAEGTRQDDKEEKRRLTKGLEQSVDSWNRHAEVRGEDRRVGGIII
jgi:hypothetical protein